jgi:general secretion pathway protein K
MGIRRRPSSRGSALLAVLWLSAALAAIAFSLANSVRGETERTTAEVSGVRAYYLATGAVERALLYMEWAGAFKRPDGSPGWEPGVSVLNFDFPTGQATVRIISEAARMNVNSAQPEDLYRLLLALGADSDRARGIVAGILDWRQTVPQGVATDFDRYYLTLNPSFRARHASFQEIEELLLVRGMTPDLFYGTYERDDAGRLTPRGGLRDCVSIFGSTSVFDVNGAEPALLAAIGLSPEAVSAIVARRRVAPFRTMDELAAFGRGPGFDRLAIVPGQDVTVRATARLRLPNGELSGERRSVAALVHFDYRNFKPDGRRYSYRRWYDDVWAQ